MRRSVGFATWLPIVAILAGACSSAGGSVTLPPAATCTTGPVTSTAAIDAVGENLDTTCGGVVGDLPWKMGATGSPCMQPIDCSPACCPCANGSYRVLASFCDRGACAAPEAVCCVVLGSTVSACGG